LRNSDRESSCCLDVRPWIESGAGGGAHLGSKGIAEQDNRRWTVAPPCSCGLES